MVLLKNFGKSQWSESANQFSLAVGHRTTAKVNDWMVMLQIYVNFHHWQWFKSRCSIHNYILGLCNYTNFYQLPFSDALISLVLSKTYIPCTSIFCWYFIFKLKISSIITYNYCVRKILHGCDGVSYVEQELPTLPEHRSSPWVLVGFVLMLFNL